MTFVVQHKRRNDLPRPFPAWIIVLFALGLVIVAVVLFRPTVRNTVEASNQVVYPTSNDAAHPANSDVQPAASNAQSASQSNAAPADASVAATPQAGQPGS